jgi:hypothetical protein
MSDELRAEIGRAPWLPASDVEPGTELDFYDMPLSGIIRQDGAPFLFVCLAGQDEPLNVWAYARLDSQEATELCDARGDRVDRLIVAALTDRMLVVALARGYRLTDIAAIDAGREGPHGIVGRFLQRLSGDDARQASELVEARAS